LRTIGVHVVPEPIEPVQLPFDCAAGPVVCAKAAPHAIVAAPAIRSFFIVSSNCAAQAQREANSSGSNSPGHATLKR
jgi:hypothetical protein